MESDWKKWGPYLSERQWGTIREDYSEEGNAWDYFPFEAAASRAYRWGEDGIGGISDDKSLLCFAFAFWNGKDPILKERFFGLSNKQGNHGEDVKEVYYYLDNTPTHSYMKMLYKYPSSSFPYEALINHNRKIDEPELEITDLGLFQKGYFDLFLEYAKASPDDILMRCSVVNQGDAKEVHVLPTIWFRNTWDWKKRLPIEKIEMGEKCFRILHPTLGERFLYFEGSPTPLFTENETNQEKLFGAKNRSPYVKDAFHEAVVHQNQNAVNPKMCGTKAALHYINPTQIRLRLSDRPLQNPFSDFEEIFKKCLEEADAFYEKVSVSNPERKKIQRQAWASLLWSKQFYHYVVEDWLTGDDPEKPLERSQASYFRNLRWRHFYAEHILLMPDKWEYPWFASWDSAFHAVAIAPIDPEFAKSQMNLLLHDRFMHPMGQVPAYEWDFENINPPLLAWAVLRIYTIEKEKTGKGDQKFLQRAFQRLLFSFTWWVNRKDLDERGVFEGGFLGMDNISLFNRSIQLPPGMRLIQSDATSWMGMFSLHMASIAFELADEGMAARFFGHFLYIGEAMDFLWHEEDGLYYDHVQFPDGRDAPIQIHSYVGLIPILCIGLLEKEKLEDLQEYVTYFRWAQEHHPTLFQKIADVRLPGKEGRRLFSLVTKERLQRLLAKLLNESEFLSPHGIRSLSRFYLEHPYELTANDYHFKVTYEPGETTSHIYGGNSNWRGPVWFPINYLFIEALEQYDQYFGESFKVECPTGSGKLMTLKEVAQELKNRLISIFEKDKKGNLPVFGESPLFQEDPNFKDYLLFYEYFHGDVGKGLGAAHQTGWTSLVALLIEQSDCKSKNSTNPEFRSALSQE